MNTKYEIVYSAFFSKLSDYDFPDYSEETLKSIIHDLLVSAVTRFRLSTDKNILDMNDEQETFNCELNETEIDILSEIMIENWLKPKLYNSDLMRNVLNTSDFSQFSPANLINAIRETYSLAHSRSESLINKYSFDIHDLSKLKKPQRIVKRGRF